MRGPEATADLLVLAAYSAALFCLGVAWAIYRAVSWVERMRMWAHSLPDARPGFSSRVRRGESTRGPAGEASTGAPLATRVLEGIGQE